MYTDMYGEITQHVSPSLQLCKFVANGHFQSSRYALKKGLAGQAFHVLGNQPLFQQGLEIWVKGSHLLYY